MKSITERMNTAHEVASEKACNTDCIRYRQGTCPYPFGEKLRCYRYKLEYDDEFTAIPFDEESGPEEQPTSYDSGYIFVLKEWHSIRGVYHSLQRAKRSAKEIGLNVKMTIVEYSISDGLNHKLVTKPLFVHKWNGRWVSDILF